MTSSVPQDMTGQGVPGYWACGDDSGGAAALRAEECSLVGIGDHDCIAHAAPEIRHLAQALRSFGDRIRLAVGNPAAIVESHGEAETMADWSTRAVLHVLTEHHISPPEHTGVSDVQADLDILRGLLTGYLRDDALGVHARDVGFEALNRIEALVRGEQR